MLTVQQREMIIKLKNDRMRQQRIAAVIGCSQAAVSKWIKKYHTGRTLETLPRSGRPTKLSKSALDKVRKKIMREVLGANERFCSLSTKQLGEIIKQEIGQEYSIRHVERIMHKLGFPLIKPRPKHIRNDPERVEKFRADFKKNSSRSMWVMSS